MEEDGEDSTPFWLQSSTDPRRGRRRSLSSFFLSSGLLIFLLCSSAVIFMFFVVPSVVSLSDRIFRPNLVKKSWDSVNIVLVLFALVFGFLSRNRNHDSNFDENHPIVSSVAKNEIQISNPSTPRQWYEYSDPTVYSSSSTGGGIRRNSCSYPDLRDASPWGNNADDNWRFSDDTRVDAHRYSDSDQFYRRRSWKRVEEEEEEEESSDRSKTVHVDTLVTRAKEVPYTPPPPPSESPPPPPPPPPTAVHRGPKRTFDSTAHKVKGPEPLKTLTPTAVTPPSPPPPPVIDSEIKSSRSERKRGGGNATKDLFTSIYHQGKKKKKQRQKSVDNFQTLEQSHTPPLNSLPPPSPPPPPPPPSVFQNLFSAKKAKSKKVLRVPPPDTAVRASKTTALVPQIAAREPPLPVKISNFNTGRESPLTGSESPSIPLPPPPPPPFKMPSWRFVVKGDYVKVGSMNSSRSVSPDPDGGDSQTSETSSEAGGTPTAADCRSPAPLFCQSPDVDTKADMFIAKFRAGLKLQKMNSMVRQKHGLGLSNLGPETMPGPRP